MVKRDRLDTLLADNEYLRTKHEAYELAVSDMEAHYENEVAKLKKELKIRKAAEAKTLTKLKMLGEERKTEDGKVTDIRPEWQKQEHEGEAKADNYCRT